MLRRLIATRHAAIVAFTALDETQVRDQATTAGFDGYCQKGQSPESLITMIRTVIQD
ncbi:hypothetical protein [Caballeronia glebae]|uniref:hypothetical protein n=1 Tax=Caballeronia glebae TaxID=1777143 RepID=UPI0038BC9311